MTLPLTAKWRIATVLLLVVILFMALVSPFNLHAPAAAEGTVPMATVTPTGTSTPTSTPKPAVPTAPSEADTEEAQTDVLFSEVEGEPPLSADAETIASRLVGIDFGQIAQITNPPIGPKDPATGEPPTPQTLVLNLFDDVVFTVIVEHVEPTASGHALWGSLEGVEMGTMTLVVNGKIVVGTVRTPGAFYTIRTASDGKYVIRQIDESSLPPLGEPLEGPLSSPDVSPPTPAQEGDPMEPLTPASTSPPSTPTPSASTEPPDADDDEAQADGLFSEVEGDPPPSPDVETLASRLAGIDFGQLDQVTNPPIEPKDPVTGKPTTPQTLVLNLFDDVVFTGIVEHVEPTASGHALWGSLQGVELGAMTLVVNGNIVVGTVRTLGAVYTIRTAGDGTYVIRQIDESSLPPLGEPLEIPTSSPGVRPKTDDGADQLDDGSVIDLMVMYTPFAKYHEGGRAAIEALIDLFVTETNQAFAKSGVIHRIKLVLRDEVDYIEKGGDSITDVRRLRGDSDGYMDHVHELRDMYAADLVHLVVGRSNTGGRAFIATDESSAFALTASYRKDLAFPHEIGHNMGLHHDRYEVGVPLTGSNYGYVNQQAFEPGAPESTRWRTIMAYPNQCSDVLDSWCAWLPYFSNPDKTYKGDPMGVPADHPSTGMDGPADAVGILNDRREIMANYRPSSTSPTPRMGLALSQYWLPEQGGVSTVTATLHRPSSEDTIVTISASPSDAVTLSANGTLTVPAGQTVSRGGVTITGVNNGDKTGDVIVEVSATAENPSSLGVIAPESVELVIADDETTPVVTLSLSPVEIVEGAGWPENQTVVTATLDNRSGVESTITVSATPAEAVEEIWSTLTIPAGQRASVGFGVQIYALDDSEFTEAEKMVTVSGNATNPHGVTGPESVTLTIIDDEAPYFASDSIAYTFTEGVAGSRALPEAAYGNGELTYSLSPAPGNGVSFTPGPRARIAISATSVAADKTSYTLTATDAEGDTDTMTVNIRVLEGVCPNSSAVSGYSEPGIVSDCEALLASRDILGGDYSLNWDEDIPIGEWERVKLSDGRVVEISVSHLGLTGAIPGELGSLDKLRTLSLNGNQLYGDIPAELGNLSTLERMVLSRNQLGGEIPTELGKLSNLRELWLHHNQLTGEIPAELENLTNLQWLYLSRNQLTGCVPDGLRDVPNNDFAGLELPFCIELACSTLAAASDEANNPGLVSDCVVLLAARDTLAGTATLNWSTDAPIADWSGVVLDGNPGRVTELQLSGLGLDGEIPTELGSLEDLRSLDLSNNQLTGPIPTELSDLVNLQELYLGGNTLTGCIPDGLSDVSINDLASLGLSLCSEHPCVSGGAVPDATNTGLVSDCETLLASRDTLAGTATLNWAEDTPITEWNRVSVYRELQRVGQLHLAERGLTGEIPKELGRLTSLEWLSLRGCVRSSN